MKAAASKPDMIPVAEIDAYIRNFLLPRQIVPHNLGGQRLSGNKQIMLGVLLQHAGHFVTDEAFVVTARYEGEHRKLYVNQYIKQLRTRLRPHGIEIENCRGVGWRLDKKSAIKLRALIAAERAQ